MAEQEEERKDQFMEYLGMAAKGAFILLIFILLYSSVKIYNGDYCSRISSSPQIKRSLVNSSYEISSSDEFVGQNYSFSIHAENYFLKVPLWFEGETPQMATFKDDSDEVKASLFLRPGFFVYEVELPELENSGLLRVYCEDCNSSNKIVLVQESAGYNVLVVNKNASGLYSESVDNLGWYFYSKGSCKKNISFFVNLFFIVMISLGILWLLYVLVYKQLVGVLNKW